MKLLDLFCGAGGAAAGYFAAGFSDITGIDHLLQKRYPFKFIQADAMEYLKEHGHEFDFIHASPPCQGYSVCKNMPNVDAAKYPKLISELRSIFQRIGSPYCIENVQGAQRFMVEPVTLCGTMFELKILRHRLFEITPEIAILTPQCRHKGTVLNGDYFCIVGQGSAAKAPYIPKKKCQELMKIDWMTRIEITQAIPPAYTEFLGKQIILQLKG